VTVGLCGGLAHILLTESYRLGAGVGVAPFDYTGDDLGLPARLFSSSASCRPSSSSSAPPSSPPAGLFVIWRERQLGLQRVRAAEGPPTGA